MHRTLRLRALRPIILSTRRMASTTPSAERVSEMKENIETIQREIKDATSKSGSNKAPTLVLVSKLKPPSDILAACAHLSDEEKHFGENYVQELVDKASQLPKEIKWHFIGGLQSNKCKALAAIPNLHVVETLDTQKKADLFEKALAAEEASDRKLNVYLQVNTSGEDSKSGLPPMNENSADDVDNTETLLGLAKHIESQCPHLNLVGLMTIGAIASSFQAKEGEQNPDFVRLCESRDRLQEKLGRNDLKLSMGMSNDFAAAIEAGSDNVRVGSRLFGQRPSKEEAKEQRAQQTS